MQGSNPDFVDYLLSEKVQLAGFKNTPDAQRNFLIHQAAAKGQDRILYALYDSTAPNSEDLDLEARDSQGRTALHLAALNKHDNTVRFLLSMGVDFDAVDNHGETPLHMAV